jgi:membrane dipeptidase
MMRALRRTVRVSATLAIIGIVAFFGVAPRVIDARANRVLHDPPYEASDAARSLMSRLFVADLHADTLLWSRDPGRRHDRGHVDIPRLIEGNVALQAFTIVTKVPWGLNIEHNHADAPDLIGWLAASQMWPRPTWWSLRQRALYQAYRLRELDREQEEFFLIRTREDLASYRRLRETNRAVTAGFLGLEGAHALEGDLDNIDVLFDAGVRMIAPTHFFDNDLAGSAHGEVKGGLTDMGREMIRRMEALGILLDLAHASPQTIDDATIMSTRPVVVSHTGVKATCDNTRNLDDLRIREIAGTGGVVAIGYWETAVCGTDAAAIVRSIRHVVDLVGIDAVALGSDFDGAITQPFDTTGLVQIVDALLAAGFTDGDIAKIMGENTARVLAQVLPAGGASEAAPVSDGR